MPYFPRHFRGLGSAIAAEIAAAGIAQHRRSLDLADLGFRVEGVDESSPVSIHQGGMQLLGERAMSARLNQLEALAQSD